MGILASNSCFHFSITKLCTHQNPSPNTALSSHGSVLHPGANVKPRTQGGQSVLGFTPEPQLPLCAPSLLFWNLLQYSNGSLPLIALQTETLRP